MSFLEQTGVPVEAVESEETTETIVPDDEPADDEMVEDEAVDDDEVDDDEVDDDKVDDDKVAGDEEDAVGSDSDEPRSEPPVDGNGDPYGDVDCEDARNHGEYVSSVTRDDSIPGPRGRVISEAARTECGRGDIGVHDAESEEVDERDEADATEESDVDHGADSVGLGDDHPANGNGKGEKRAAGKGRGNGRG